MVRLIRGSMGRYSARTVRRVTTASSLGAEMACDDCCDLMLQADRDQRAKEEKIRIAIQKIKAADIKKVNTSDLKHLCVCNFLFLLEAW